VAYTYGQDPRSDARTVASKLRRESADNPIWQQAIDLAMAGLRKWERVGEATEMAERVAVYRKFIKAGASIQQAAFEASLA